MSNPDRADRVAWLLRLQRVAQTDGVLRNLLADSWHLGYGAGIASTPSKPESNPFHRDVLAALPAQVDEPAGGSQASR